MIGALDAALGRVTMYRLVVISLAVVTAIAVLLSAIGELFFSPLEMLASAAVLLGVSLGANAAFAALFRVRAHTESTVITAQLLFFLFWPSLAPVELLTLALAAFAAVASKYLIAVRGRHVLNPAAAGAMVVALTQQNFAVWWVATPVLVVATAVAAVLVFVRTRRPGIALVFAGLATALIGGQLIASGAALPDALLVAATSYPVVFFATFMLTEPLTLPPRRWQQFAVAGVVAVLFSVPFSVGPVYSSPELALLVGNVVAFLFGQRGSIRLEFLERRRLTPGSWELVFRPARELRFRPGQYLELSLPHRRADIRGARRVFSIASGRGDEVRFGLRVPERHSSFKTALLELEPGSVVSGTSVGGEFSPPRGGDEPLLVVAGGIGITPFVSWFEEDARLGIQRDVRIVYLVSSAAEIPYAAELERCGHPVLLVGPEAPEVLPPGWSWLPRDEFAAGRLEQLVPGLRTRRAYVSGAPGLVSELGRALRHAGVRRIHRDTFSGY